MEKRDFYEILNVPRNATTDEIKKAYRKLAHQYHPDKNPNNPQAEEAFREATQAYETLSDEEKRRNYDAFGSFQGMSGESININDVFGDIFSDMFRGKRKKKPRRRGHDLRVPLEISFKEAAFGGEKTIEVTGRKACGACVGTGAKPGTHLKSCPECGGNGQVRFQQGLFSMTKTCPQCRGEGKIIEHPCPQCSGQGFVEVTRSLKIKIPPGIDHDQKLRIPKEGEPGIHGGAPGDLYVHIQILPHKIFKRKGSNLHLEIPIPLTIAALGGEIMVPTLEGEVKMKIPPGTQSGKVFRLRGKGLASTKGFGKGDQHVQVHVETPQNISDEQEQILQEFDRVSQDENYPLVQSFRKNKNGDE